MARVRLKGINSKRKRLADGTEVTYYWAYRGGPRLPGKPGSPEFVQAYYDAYHAKRPAPANTLLAVMNAYQDSGDFKKLAPRTRADYITQIRKIETSFSDFPLTALKDRRSRAIFLKWRDGLAEGGKTRQADYAAGVLAIILSWAYHRGLIEANPTEKLGRLHRGTRVEKTWSAETEARFMASAPPHLRLAFVLALWTGQRQGDLLRITWKAYDGQYLRLTQQKTDVPVIIPVAAPLKALLDPIRGDENTPILKPTRGTAWTSTGFQTSWRKACLDAGVTGVTFHDLRGTAVTRLAKAGATVPEIATLTGHSLKEVQAILDRHYLSRDVEMAESAIRKREAAEKISDRSSDRAA